MFDLEAYIRVLLSVTSGLITLVGSVGIFVSLTVQRRIERLQDTLEQFMDLSYHNSANLTGTMFRLIEKYQMHYQLPDSPSRKILNYINVTIAVVIFAWLNVLLLNIKTPLQWESIPYFVPIALSLAILIFYRYLLKNAINPIDNGLFTPLIPPPSQLRSVSFLSKYVNVSVITILKHARLRLVVKNRANKSIIILKEELSFDDYLYYIEIKDPKNLVFIGFGELKLIFPDEPITGKPVPAVKNINIPLGNIPWEEIKNDDLTAKLFIFPRGEKHPIEYTFHLHKQSEGIYMVKEPEMSINYMTLFRIQDNQFELMDYNPEDLQFNRTAKHFVLDGQRRYWHTPTELDKNNIKLCDEKAYVD